MLHSRSAPPAHQPLPPSPLPLCSALLERILELLLGFVGRTHQALAGVGVAALVRLIVAAGPQLDEERWMMVRAGAERAPCSAEGRCALAPPVCLSALPARPALGIAPGIPLSPTLLHHAALRRCCKRCPPPQATRCPT
jgi:hypothetical protein